MIDDNELKEVLHEAGDVEWLRRMGAPSKWLYVQKWSSMQTVIQAHGTDIPLVVVRCEPWALHGYPLPITLAFPTDKANRIDVLGKTLQEYSGREAAQFIADASTRVRETKGMRK